MIGRPRAVALVFALLAVLLTVALVRATRTTLALERAERDARTEALFEERNRLALWRMDAALATLLGTENTLPADQLGYRSTAASSTVPAWIEQRIDLRLDAQDDRVPPWARPLAIFEPPPPVKTVAPDDRPDDPWAVLTTIPGVQTERINVGGNESGNQASLNLSEFAQRRDFAAGQQGVWYSNDARTHAPKPARAHAFTPAWVGSELLLWRQVERTNGRFAQVVRTDWPALRTLLLDEVADLLPAADLEPDRARDDTVDPGRQLALLPLRLVPGAAPATLDPAGSLHRTLILMWAAAALALVGSGVLLVGSQRLGARRADFVSAVTHELRTPLTTFRLYTDLLSDEPPDPADRRRYLTTLTHEGERLGHLVDNVLAFARLEQRAPLDVHTVTTGGVLARIQPRLAERVSREGGRLAVDGETSCVDLPMRVEPDILEQILLNLVDNACKYALAHDVATHNDAPVVTLALLASSDQIAWIVRDRGPGLDATARRHLFEPFRKGARRAAASAPGVGIGLALSRRLARRMGGDLVYQPAAEGTAFALYVPRA